MTQTHLSSTPHSDEVLRFWGLQANQLQAAYEALWSYLESPNPASSPWGEREPDC